MDSRKRKRLEAAGWRVGTAAELLGLSDQEATLLEMRVALCEFIRSKRSRGGLTQGALAERLKSSQSRVAKMEAGDPSVSLDLLVRAALAAGASRAEVAKVLGKRTRAASA